MLNSLFEAWEALFRAALPILPEVDLLLWALTLEQLAGDCRQAAKARRANARAVGGEARLYRD
jgi:hypothetical protein